jgi:putative redox protein
VIYNPVVAKPPTVVDLAWTHDLVLEGTSDKATMTLDSAGIAGPSPVQALGFALAGCMTMDVAYILTKGRQPFRALRSHLIADRAQEEPHRIVKMHLQVTVEGDVPADAVARALALSHEKYCSVWHSMRQDIVFTTTHDVQP